MTMRHTDKKRRLWLTTLFLLFLLHLSVLTAYRISKNAGWSDVITDASLQRAPIKSVGERRPSSKPNPSPARVVYPNSVIRGGVRTPEEFKAALLKDGVVAAHFSDFNGPKSRIIELKTDKAAYVSYRINDKVYWTKKKVSLAKGERLLTDGTNYARARCGNRISEVSQAPTSAAEPAFALLDTPIPIEANDPLLVAARPQSPVASPDHLGSSASGFAPVPGAGSHAPGFLIPGIIGGGAVAGRVFGPGGDPNIPGGPVVALVPSPPPSADVPEPSTLIFLASGLGSAIALRKRFRTVRPDK
jgi:PEP-CTERM motif-containing protein